jgi:hypothetical protein
MEDIPDSVESTLDSTQQLRKEAGAQQELQNYVSFRMTTPKKWEELVQIVEDFDWYISYPHIGKNGNKGKTTLRLIEILPMYFDTSLKTSRRDCSAISSPRPLSRKIGIFLFFKNRFLREKKASQREEMSDGTREDTTESVQIEEIKRAIQSLPFVTKLSPVRAHKSHGAGGGVSLRCSSCKEYGNCGKKQEPLVQVSSVHPTELACLQEMLR